MFNFNGEKHTRHYVRPHQLAYFEILMNEHDVTVFNEIEHTGTKSGTFYVRKVDINRVDEICLSNEIHLGDDYSILSGQLHAPSGDEHWINRLPRYLKLFSYFILFIIVLYFIFGN